MPRKSVNELITQANSSFPDNSGGLITPALLRNFVLDFLNAFSPAYGYLTRTTPNTQTLGLTDLLMVFETAYDSDGSQTTTTVPASRITRAEKGTSVINFTVDMETNAGRKVTFTLYKNGVATPWRITGDGGGTANPVAVALTAIDYADPAAYYSIHAQCEVAATAVILSNAALILSVEPVRSFT